MKWFVTLLLSGILTLVLLDLGLFERERFFIADIVERLPFVDRGFLFYGATDAAHASDDARLAISTVIIILGLYGTVRFLLEILPPRWFTLDNGSVGRLPDPRLLADRVRTHENNPRLKKLLYTTNGRWMAPLAAILLFFLFVSLPVALLDRTYYWVWGLSLLVPIALICCAFNPDRPHKTTMTTHELKEHLTPKTLRDDRSGRMWWRRLRTIIRHRRRRLRTILASSLRIGPRGAPKVQTTGEPTPPTSTSLGQSRKPTMEQGSERSVGMVAQKEGRPPKAH